MYTRYTCIYTIYTPNTPLNTPSTIYAAQIVLLVSLIDYSKNMEEAIAGGTLGVYLEKHVDELNKLINLTMKIDNKEDRQRVMCMITMDTHGRDICMNLMRDKVRGEEREERTEREQRTEREEETFKFCVLCDVCHVLC